MPFTVVIIGRPNVGKSTLFNRLMKRKYAIVADTPGVTRDRREGETIIGERPFKFIDTAGLDEADKTSIEGRMSEQTKKAITEADLALFLIDARTGLIPVDQYFAKWLRAQHIPVLLLANKCEGKAGESGLLDSFALGLGDPIAISAEHGKGITDLFDALINIERTVARQFEKKTEDLSESILETVALLLVNLFEARL